LIIVRIRNHNSHAFHAITCLSFVRLEDRITLSTLVYIIAFIIILTHDLIIYVVMTTNEISQYTTVRSSGQIQPKLTNEGEERYIF
jgi:hypothetical protein